MLRRLLSNRRYLLASVCALPIAPSKQQIIMDKFQRTNCIGYHFTEKTKHVLSKIPRGGQNPTKAECRIIAMEMEMEYLDYLILNSTQATFITAKMASQMRIEELTEILYKNLN